MSPLLKNTDYLKEHIAQALYAQYRRGGFFVGEDEDLSKPSAVLLLLTNHCGNNGSLNEPCLILNKRSQNVRQAGDLCCPGGGVSERFDSLLAHLLRLPYSPLSQWPFWRILLQKDPVNAHLMARLFATSLRESFEEIRLNPLGVEFLGPLPTQRLVVFRRYIHPLVGWVKRQKRYTANWEVEKLLYLPLSRLLDPGQYRRYRIHFFRDGDFYTPQQFSDYPCFVHNPDGEEEILWGATYRIVTVFMRIIFDFRPPHMASLPSIRGTLDKNYYRNAQEI
jgi:hypothetical protein